jgi:hypothetical protein
MSLSLYWGRHGGWEPQGGRGCDWKDLTEGDLITFGDRKIWQVIQVRPSPVADWEDHAREYWQMLTAAPDYPGQIRRRRPASEEEWDGRPLDLIVVPAGGGRRHHVGVRPYEGRRAYVLNPHYPVCRDCGEPWPCRELEITQEIGRESARLAWYEELLPGCCWGCGAPVTGRQKSIRFDGENLLLPGAVPPVFHLRRARGCAGAASGYEKRWIAADESRLWRLQCTGHLTSHVDGRECTEGPLCPGTGVRHHSFRRHAHENHPDGSVTVIPGMGGDTCCRCKDALERGDGARLASSPRRESGR